MSNESNRDDTEQEVSFSTRPQEVEGSFEGSMVNPSKDQLIAKLKEELVKLENDPSGRVRLEDLALGIYATTVFKGAKQELEELFSAYAARYEGEGGTTTSDLSTAYIDINNLLGRLTNRLQIKPMVGHEDEGQQGIVLLDEMPENGLNLLSEAIARGDKSKYGDLIRLKSSETRGGIVESLWEVASIFKDESQSYAGEIPKDIQSHLFQELKSANDFSSRLIEETILWLEEAPHEEIPVMSLGTEK